MKFQGNGPPPDPKFNFLADSERETHVLSGNKTDDDKRRSRNQSSSRGFSKRRTSRGEDEGNATGGSNQAFFKVIIDICILN